MAKTFGQVIHEMLDHEGNRIIPVHSSLVRVARGNGKKKPSTITIVVPDDMIDGFFRSGNPYSNESDQTAAFMVCLDRETTNRIACGNTTKK